MARSQYQLELQGLITTVDPGLTQTAVVVQSALQSSCSLTNSTITTQLVELVTVIGLDCANDAAAPATKNRQANKKFLMVKIINELGQQL